MATVTKYRGRWCADFRDAHRKRRIEVPEGHFKNMAQEKLAAQALLTKRLAEVSRGDYQPHAERPNFEKLCTDYLQSKVKIRHTTRRDYESAINLYLIPYFRHWKVHSIGGTDLERFRSEMTTGLPPPVLDALTRRIAAAKPGLSQARAKQRAARTKPGLRTVNKCLVLLFMIFEYAMRNRLVERNPAIGIDKLQPQSIGDDALLDLNVLAPAEVNALLAAAEAPHRDRDGKLISSNYKLLFKVAIYSGMRQGELLGLQWGDIDWNSRQIYVRRAWKEGVFTEPKTKTSQRRIELTESLIRELKEWRLACPKGAHDLCFPNLEGAPMSPGNLMQRGFYPALRRAGLRKIRFHDLRHTYATLMIRAGEDVVRVSRLLGHSSPKITLDIYAHQLPSAHYGSAEKLAALIDGNQVATEPVSAPTAA